MEEFASNIMSKCGWDYMRAIQYLEHCIRSCYWAKDYQREADFVSVRDYIERRYR